MYNCQTNISNILLCFLTINYFKKSEVEKVKGSEYFLKGLFLFRNVIRLITVGIPVNQCNYYYVVIHFHRSNDADEGFIKGVCL